MPANPPFLLFDTDCLIQAFMTRQRGLLAKLRQHTGVVPAVVPEVEVEVRFHRKFKGQYEPAFLRSLASKAMAVLDRNALRGLLAERGIDQPDVAARELQRLDEEARRYSAHVDEGEAYTHAIAAMLGLPVVSHDWKAVTVLQRLGYRVGVPTLRFFDLLLFGFAAGWITEEECESARRYLRNQAEYMPREFQGSVSFRSCTESFACRLRRAASVNPSPPRSATDVLELIELPGSMSVAEPR